MIDVTEIIEGVSGPLTDPSVRQKIEELEAHWKTLPQVDIPVVESYSGGIYAREIIIPADTLLTGRVYKHDHFDVMVYGDVTVTSDEGLKRLQGYNAFPSCSGKKRAGYTHEETRWITFCACEERPTGDYLEYLTVETFAQLEADGMVQEACIEKVFRSQESYRRTDYPAFKAGYLAAVGKLCREDVDRADYNIVLKEYGFSESVARKQSEGTDDMDGKSYNILRVRKSRIEGRGLYLADPVQAGDVIAPARVAGKRTTAGRYTNHSARPNAIMIQKGNDIDLVAVTHIGDEEVTVDYRDALNLQIKKAC